MTAFTCNTGVDEFFDAKAGGSSNATLDTYAISNRTRLVVRTDSYACANHSTAFGSLDTVTFSGTGGTAGTDKAVTLIGIRPGSGKFAVATGTLSRSKGISLSLVGEQDRVYSA